MTLGIIIRPRPLEAQRYSSRALIGRATKSQGAGETRSSGRVGSTGLRITLSQGCMWLMMRVGHSFWAKDSKSFMFLTSFQPHKSLGRQHYYHKVTDEETEAWRGEVTCLCKSDFRVSTIFHEGHITLLCTSVLDEWCMHFIRLWWCYCVWK